VVCVTGFVSTIVTDSVCVTGISCVLVMVTGTLSMETTGFVDVIMITDPDTVVV